MRILYDISPELSGKTAVWPGDVPFGRSVSMDFAKGDHLALSAVQTTLHIGAHTDAPNHYHAQGESMDQRGLEPYAGPCQVISVRLPRGERILPEHVRGREIQAPRVLFRTGSFPDPNSWNDDFNSLSPELIDELAATEVILVGIDTPSVDPMDSKSLESHQALFRANMSNLEGVVLDRVPDGLYFLVALPLKIQGGDASPVRAVLMEMPS